MAALDLPTTQSDAWPSERVASTVADHALAQWGSIELANSISEHVVKCEDIYMITHDGRKLIDFNSQAVCTNLGYSCPEIAEAVFDQMKNGCAMAESRWYVCTVRAKVIDFLMKKMPTMDRFYFSESGATAIEASVRIARAYTGRPIVLASSRSYHGATAGAMTLTGGGDDRHFTANGGHMENVVHFMDHTPFTFQWGEEDDSDAAMMIEEEGSGKVSKATQRFLAYLEEIILTNGGSNRIAAILLETMVGTQGAIPSTDQYLLGIQSLARKYGIILILDEVMGGFGRTGKWFAYQNFEGLEPDIVTMAKGLTNAYAPLGGVAVTKKIGDHFLKNAVPMGSTYNCHPVGLAAAYASLQLYEQRNTFEHVNKVAAPEMAKQMMMLQMRLRHLVKASRSYGLWGAIEVRVADPITEAEKHQEQLKRVAAVLKRRGLVTFAKYNRHMRALYFMCNPPLCITKQQLVEAFDILAEAIQAVEL